VWAKRLLVSFNALLRDLKSDATSSKKKNTYKDVQPNFWEERKKANKQIDEVEKEIDDGGRPKKGRFRL
jgi:hypothetical protein